MVIITESEIRFEDIYKKPYVTSNILDEIKKANALILPNEGFRDKTDPMFPEETSVFFEYLKSHSDESGLLPDICIDDENYKLLELHDAELLLPSLIVTSFILPVVINLISSYLYDKIKQKREDFNIEIKIIEQDKDVSKSLEYKGPASDFKRSYEIAAKDLFKEYAKDEKSN